MAYTSPVYYTSQIYPVVVVETMQASGVPGVSAMYDSDVEQMKISGYFLSGVLLGSSLLTYTNWPVEQIKANGDFISGTIVLGILIYTNWPVEQIKANGNFISGSIALGLITYSNWPTEQMKLSGNFLAGTLI